MTGVATWGWADMTGETYIWNNHSSLAFSVEDRDVMYIVTNLATEGDFAGDPANLEDPCYFTTWEDYTNRSEDIYVLKSEDGGDTWTETYADRKQYTNRTTANNQKNTTVTINGVTYTPKFWANSTVVTE